VQKVIDPVWRSEIETIYQDYSIYHQSDGVEQAVFDASSGQASLRSDRLLATLAEHVKLPEEGRMIDLGCGTGAMLRAFSRFAPHWTLAGAELNDRTRATIESIPGVEALYVGAPDQIPGNFDVVTMVHVLEHIPEPVEYLSGLSDKLKPGGLLVIEVPNYLRNPFDVLVADHSSHFTARTAADLIRRAGYEVMFAATDWVPKELTLVARKTPAEIELKAEPELDPFEAANSTVRWLRATLRLAREGSRVENFGLFGTSIASTWLFAEIGDDVSFFVDEDPARIGKTFMGHPVYHPRDTPAGSRVFIALSRAMAETVHRRFVTPGVEILLPPPLDS
jgi:2-polyprenyl-3-methyl-5-hydroxy-6-metoxy-1,4-benzoquinol methylase